MGASLRSPRRIVHVLTLAALAPAALAATPRVARAEMPPPDAAPADAAAAAPTPPAPGTSPVAAATAAATPAAAFDAAADAHYGAMLDGSPCAKQGGCPQTVVKEVALGGGRVVQLRRGSTEYGDAYAVVFGGGDAWFAADAIDSIQREDCGMMKCVDETIRKITVTHRGDQVWVHLRLRVVVSHSEPRRTEAAHRSDILVGCTLGAAPTCVTFVAGGAFEEGRATLTRSQVHLVDLDGDRYVPVPL